MIRIVASLVMAAGLMLFLVAVNGALQSEKAQAHMGWQAKSERIAASAGGPSLLQRFIVSFREVVSAEKEPPKSDLQKLLDRRRRDTAPFDLGDRMPVRQPVNR